MLQPATLADLPAFLCAHAEDARAGTGCTVFIAPDGATCGVDVRGGGPATRETDLLKPENMIQAVHGVVLSGGSAFGLAAATGVMDELAARGIGFPGEPACSICWSGRTPIPMPPWGALLRGRRSSARRRNRWPKATWAPDAAHRWASSSAASAP